MVSIYLASRFQDLMEVRGLAERLRLRGAEITASWLEQEPDKNMVMIADKHVECREIALRDIHDINAAEVVVVLSPEKAHNNGTGGRHVEFGYALGLGKPLILYGKKENVFHYHPSCVSVDTEEEIYDTALLWHEIIGKKSHPRRV